MTIRFSLPVFVGLLLVAGLAQAQTPGTNVFGAPGAAAPMPRMVAPPSPPPPSPRFQGMAPTSPTLPPPSPPFPGAATRAVAPPPHAAPRPLPAPGWTPPTAGEARPRPAPREAERAHGHERADSRRHWRRHRPITPYEIAPPEYQGLTPAPWGGPTPPERYQPGYDRPQVKPAPGPVFGRRCAMQKKKVWRKGRLVRRWTRVCR